MAMQSFPFTSEVTFDERGFPQFDRAVGSDVLRNLLSNYYTNGVFGLSNTNCFKVVSYVGGGMALNVQPGACHINGVTAYNKEETRVTLDKSESLPRIDAIVLRLDDNKAQRSIRVEVIKGIAQSNPQRPAPVREGVIYDLVLAYVSIRPNVSTITNAEITDVRLETAMCGFVTAISKIDVNSLYTQQRTLFDAWFEEIKGQLGTDAAGNLQNQINALKEDSSFGADVKALQNQMNLLAPKISKMQTEINSANNAVKGVTDAFEINGRNVKAKGTFEVNDKFNAKNGLIIGGNDTLIVRRFAGTNKRDFFRPDPNDVAYFSIQIAVPAGYKTLGAMGAYTHTNAEIRLIGFSNNNAFCSVKNPDGKSNVPIRAEVDVLFYRCDE